MAKKKIFIWGDSPTCSTGFGNVAKNLFGQLYKTYDVDYLGINYFGNIKYDPIKWFIYSIEQMDPYGFKRLPTTIKASSPDVIVLFQDIFNIEHIIDDVAKAAPNTPIIVYYPIDGSPISTAWIKMMTHPAIKKHFIYSEFSKREIKKAFGDKAPDSEILYHGVNMDSYHLLTEEDRIAARASLDWQDRFMIINVNVFQPRKFIMGTLLAGSLFRHGYKKCKCGNYYLSKFDTCALNGCGKEDVLEEVGPKDDVGLYLHMSIMNRAMGPLRSNLLHSHALNAGWLDSDLLDRNLFLLDQNRNISAHPFTEEELNIRYNAANVNISTTVGEGKLLEGTLVLSSEGYKPIEQILEKDLVVNDQGNWAKVSKTRATDFTENMYSIKLYKFTEPIICSNDHPFLTKSGEYKKAEDLTIKDRIALKIPKWEEAVPGQIDLANYVNENFLIEEDCIKSTKSDKKFARFIPINEETCRFFGLYVAEGSSNKGNVRFSFHQKEIEFHKFIENVYQKYFNIFKDYKTPEFKQSKRDKSGCIRLAGYAFKMFHAFFGDNAHTKKFPLWMMNLSESCKRAFIQGIVDGDGYSVKEGRYNGGIKFNKIRTVSGNLAYLLRDLYLTLGELPSIYNEDNSHGHGNGRIYAVVNFPIETQYGGGAINQITDSYEITDDYIYLKIMKIEEMPPSGKGYDLQVPEGESYTIAQCTLHNCGLSLIESSACGTTTIAPNNSAIPEILKDTGHLIKNGGVFTQGMDNGHIRPVISIPSAVDTLEIEYKKWVDNDRKKIINQAAIENVTTRFRWDDKIAQFERSIEEVLNEKAPN